MSIVKKIKIPEFCPECNKTSIAYILYGLPDFEVIGKDLETKAVLLGGCVFCEASPQWHCNSCSYEWGELLEIEDIRADKRKNEKRIENKKREAIARGVMDAYVNENGAVRCPYCNFSFKIKHGLSDNNAHKSCGTYLNIKQKQ
ncbi:hypothetical protein MNBD_GAMMA10-438 [hydrothermal vent metagenome]|uniref:Uncharacterized protein n=1 Tax=hydrothermal vent metagenome TaxID=652676 RepID=A0A3B0XKD5_9ZZZZ